MPASLMAGVDQEPPEVCGEVHIGPLREHHEADELTVGLDRPHPRDDRLAVDDLGHERVGVRLRHRRDEPFLRVMSGQPSDLVDVLLSDLDETHVRRWPLGSLAPGETLVDEDRVAVVVGPLTSDVRRLHTPPLVPETQPLEHARRRGVRGIQRRRDTVHVQPVDQPVDESAGCFGRVAAALMRGIERITDQRGADVSIEIHGQIADERSIDVVDRDLDPLAGHWTVDADHLVDQLVGEVPGVRQLPVLVAGDLGQIAVSRERRHVGRSHGAQCQPLGREGEEAPGSHGRNSTPHAPLT